MRLEDWPNRMADAIADAQQRKFEWGGHDCCLFPADVVNAMTGVDHAAPLRGYDSKESAYAIIAQYGSLESMVSTLLQKDPVHPALAMRGDVVMAELEEGPTLGVCVGALCAFPAAVGLTFRPRAAVQLAWRIE